jgi:branched-chain amino acid aminotransferase
VREERFTIESVFEANEAGKLSEVFASGTATVISPVGDMRWKNREIQINKGDIGPLSKRLYDAITGIQTGELPDKYGWTVEV